MTGGLTTFTKNALHSPSNTIQESSAIVCSLVFSVVIWCDNVGDIQWGEDSLPWDESTHPRAEVGGRRQDAKANQCCMH